MSDDSFMKMVDIALEHTGKHAGEAAMWKRAFESMCTYYLSLTDGDTHYVENAFDLMREHGIVDEDGFEIVNEDE